MISVDLPPPETPVTQVKVPSGMSTRDVLQVVGAGADDADAAGRVAPARRCFGSGIWRKPVEVLAGEAVGVAHHLLGRAAATTRPPWTPAPGPMSIR